MPEKITKKYYSYCSLMKCFFLYLLRNSTGEICVWVKELSDDLNTKLT